MDGVIRTYALQIPKDWSRGDFDPFRALVSQRRLEALARLRHEQTYRQSLLGEALARWAAGRTLGRDAGAVEFVPGSHGKPLVRGGGAEVNVSHSGEWVVCAIGETAVGADVEEVKPIDPEIARGYFSPEERRRIEALPEEGRLRAFYRTWTLKESYIKALGTGLSTALDSFSVDFSDPDAVTISGASRPCAFKLYPLADGYELSVCSFGGEFAPAVERVTPGGLLVP